MTTIAAVTQAYDLAGNVVTGWSADRGTSYVYRWDHHNRLTAIFDGATGSTRKAAFSYDALGRRIEYINDVLATTARFYFDGVNELVQYDGSNNRSRYWVHGIGYIDERLMMYWDSDSRPYYYVLDRMYNVRALVDRAGALVERYVYDGYGRPYIREMCGRGDMNNNTALESGDTTLFGWAKNGTIWDPRADLDDDGDVDAADQTAYDAKQPVWDWWMAYIEAEGPAVAQAFSDVGNLFMFQGVPHYALDTAADASQGTLMLNHHRARMSDPVTGRWLSRDPLVYREDDASRARQIMSPRNRPISRSSQGAHLRDMIISQYSFLGFNPSRYFDASGLSNNCGTLSCACQSGESHVDVYEDSDRARAIIGNGCVTLLNPPGIYCTGTCAQIDLWIATDPDYGPPIPVLYHECCHWCDVVDGGLARYCYGWLVGDLFPSSPANCNNRPVHAEWYVQFF